MRIIKLLLLLFMSSCSMPNCINTKQNKDLSNFRFPASYPISSSFNPQTSTLNILITLEPNFHAYAPGETIGRAIDISISPKNNWLADGLPVIPTGTKRALADLGYSIVLQGKIPISQKLKPGSGAGEATLFFQVCTDHMCDRPRTEIINWH